MYTSVLITRQYRYYGVICSACEWYNIHIIVYVYVPRTYIHARETYRITFTGVYSSEYIKIVFISTRQCCSVCIQVGTARVGIRYVKDVQSMPIQCVRCSDRRVQLFGRVRRY